MTEQGKRYYTNVARSGNKVLVREVRNGVRRKFKVDYRPTLYVPSRNHESVWKTPDGSPVDPIQPGSMKECREFIDHYNDVNNFRVYGNTAYEYAFIAEEYTGTIEYDIRDIVVCNLDIEVASENGFPEPAEASEEITAITVKSSKDGIFHVFACKEFESSDDSVVYHQCEDEEDLGERFLEFWSDLQPDVLLGWNCKLFDIPYLVNRFSKILSRGASRLSPWGIIKETVANIFNEPHQVYDIVGVSILDYLLLYKKNVLKPRDSYKLDYIAEVELSERKLDYGEYGNLNELYKQNFQKFVEYNIHDVRLVDKLDAKLRLIELQLLIAYDGKVNFQDVFSQVRTWDTKLYNHLLKKNVVVPMKSKVEKGQQFSGAYVMEPVVGMHEWVMSFDIASLYPSVMVELNCSFETIIDKANTPVDIRIVLEKINPDYLLDVSEKIEEGISDDQTEEFLRLQKYILEHDYSLAANGTIYKRSPDSSFTELITDLLTRRAAYKKKAQDAKKLREECHDPEEKEKYSMIISDFDLKQMVTKVGNNSLYGCIGTNAFRFYNVDVAVAVTATGKFIIQYVGRQLNKFLNVLARTNGVPYRIYSDTDSVYLALKEVVNAIYNKDVPSDPRKIVEILSVFASKKIEPKLVKIFDRISKDYLNGRGGAIKMKREVIADKGIWCAKKRYLLNVWDSEGVRKKDKDGNWIPDLKYMGVEIAKSSVPKFCRENMKESVNIIFQKDQNELFEYISSVKKKFLKLSHDEIAFPRSVNGLTKYGDHAKIFKDRTPFHVKGALLFNHLVDCNKMGSSVPKIREGEKIKFIHMKEPNKFRCNCIAFNGYIPSEFGVEKYLDIEKQWLKSFIEPLSLILDSIGWKAEKRASLNDLFGDD